MAACLNPGTNPERAIPVYRPARARSAGLLDRGAGERTRVISVHLSRVYVLQEPTHRDA